MASWDHHKTNINEAKDDDKDDGSTAVEKISALPGVTAAGMIDQLPLGMGGSDRGVAVPGYEFTEGERRSLYYAYAREGYLEAMGVTLLGIGNAAIPYTPPRHCRRPASCVPSPS